MTEPLLNLTIVFEPAEDGWVVASIPEIPGVHSQGKSREEARENVIDALHEILAIRFGEGAPSTMRQIASPCGLSSLREAPRPRAPSAESRRRAFAGGRQAQRVGL